MSPLAIVLIKAGTEYSMDTCGSTKMSSRKRKDAGEAETGPAAKRQKAAAAASTEADPSSAQPARRGAAHHAPSVQNIVADPLTLTSLEYWAQGAQQKKPFDPAVVENIFKKELDTNKLDLSRVMLLELSFYLEKYPFKSPGNPHRIIFPALSTFLIFPPKVVSPLLSLNV